MIENINYERIEKEAYHDEEGNIRVDEVCGWCGSNSGFDSESDTDRLSCKNCSRAVLRE